jgi:AraC-like DNA-binding protein
MVEQPCQKARLGSTTRCTEFSPPSRELAAKAFLGRGSLRAYWVPMASVPPARHLLRARDLADARYFESIQVADMARAARLSSAHFSREFHRAFGESPHRYLLTRRLERAAALLRTTDRNVADVCFMVGLSSVGSFTSSFRRMFGVSPTAYRAAHPPASDLALIPACVVRKYSRPENRTFREDRRNGVLVP